MKIEKGKYYSDELGNVFLITSIFSASIQPIRGINIDIKEINPRRIWFKNGQYLLHASCTLDLIKEVSLIDIIKKVK